MAKPRKNSNGTWTITVQHAGDRRTLTLGKISKSDARYFLTNLNRLIDHARHGEKSIRPEIQAWLETLTERHLIQLSEIGLFEYRSAAITVEQLCQRYLEWYNEKPLEQSTKTKVETTLNNRVDKIRRVRLNQIEPQQRSVRRNAGPVMTAEGKRTLKDFNSWQRNHYAPATWTRDNKLLSAVGRFAVAEGYCDFNPFAELPTASMINEERNQYVEASAVIDAMESTLRPDTRLVLAMGRFAGLRTCSEVRTLKWRHIDFERGQIEILDSKKKTPRRMPLFDNIRDELQLQREITGDTSWVASDQLRHQSDANNFRLVKAAIRRSGSECWPRIRQNLRASCENDLLKIFPERLVTSWLGHTVKVSRAHYQKQRDSDYLRAIEVARESNQ